MTFTYSNFGIDEADLGEIRHALYHSEGPGYFVMPGFLDPLLVHHVREVWSKVEPFYKHEKFRNWSDYSVDSPNVENRYPDGSYFFNNFLHNDPLDVATHSVSGYIAILRNRIEGKNPLNHVLPHDVGAVAYRVYVSRNIAVGAPPHRDWVESATYDPGALQATLLLSTRGVDYDGEGFSLVRNDGRRVTFGEDVSVEAGDLVFWRFNNQHSIMNVRTRDDQIGFIRIVYSSFVRDDSAKSAPKKTGDAKESASTVSANAHPAAPAASPQEAPAVESVTDEQAADAGPVFAGALRQAIKRTSIGRRVIVPLYRRIRYRS